VAGRRTLLFDLDEVLAEIDRNPSMRPPSKMHGAVVPLSEPVRITDVPRRVTGTVQP
jgi:hypothetical protein